MAHEILYHSTLGARVIIRSVSEEGSYFRLMDLCINQFWASVIEKKKVKSFSIVKLAVLLWRGFAQQPKLTTSTFERTWNKSASQRQIQALA